MKRSSVVRLLALVLILVIPVLFLTARFLQPTNVARGKSAAIPLSGEMTPEQIQAQELALDDALVQAYTAGHRSEVFGVRQVFAGDYPGLRAACAGADCRQVEIYNFDENAAVTAVVNLTTGTVLDVYYLEGMHPGINKRLADRAIEIALNAPEVADALGYRPTNGTMAPVPGDLLKSSCAGEHLCAAPSFKVGEDILWAIVDLTEDRLAGISWTYAGSDEDVTFVPFVPEGCPPSGSFSRDGWSLNHEVTGTDGLNVYDVTFNGQEVLTSVKMVEWHADYGSSGYRDSTGCGGGGGGFPIYPYGNTEILDIEDGPGNVIGFEVVQDFRMSSWGSSCNYRYDQRIRFYEDGSFRVASGAYGKGCGTNSMYRPVVRIDIAVDGDPNDSFDFYEDGSWVDVATETYRTPYAEAGHGPHDATAENFSWRVEDTSGVGYNIEQDFGQFPPPPLGVPGRGSDPFIYFTLHHANEGDGDLGVIGACCNDDHRQGPDLFVNGENIEDTNVVMWYVPQMLTDVTPGDYYCWTVTGEPNPETYPCFTGPVFRPYGSAEPDYAMTTTPESQDICVPENAVYTVETEALNGYVGNITLSASGNPGSASFVPNPVAAGNNSTLTISGAGAGNYTFDVEGDSGGLTHSNSVGLNVFAAAPSAPALSAPPNGANNVSLTPLYSWNASAGATSYFIEVATDPAFANVVDSATVEETSYHGQVLLSGETYYWRVSADNACGGNTSATWSFTTLVSDVLCSTPNLSIPDNDPAGVTNDLVIGDPGSITDLNVTLDVTHTWVGDLVFELEHVETGTSVVFYDRPGVPASTFGCSGNDIDATLDDEAATPVEDECGGGVPTIQGSFIPNNLLAAFDGEDIAGTWRITASDLAGGDTGTLNEWCIDAGTTGGPEPDIDVDPTSMSSTQSTNTVVVQQLEVSNVGSADLDWSIAEVDTTLDGKGGSCDAPSDIAWLTVNPTSDTTPPSATTLVDVTYDSTGYTAGVYTGDLCVFSNDPDEELVVVPVTMTVEQPTDVGVSGFGGDGSVPSWLLWAMPLTIVALLGLFLSAKRLGRRESH